MTPALFTRISTLPNSSLAFWIRPCAWLSSVTSQMAASTRPLSPSMRSTRPASRSSLLAATTTAAPSLASASAVASPMPLEAPVTTATLPSNCATLKLLPSVKIPSCLRCCARLRGLQVFGRLDETQVRQRPVGVVEGADSARDHEHRHQEEDAADHASDHAGGPVVGCEEGYRGPEQYRPEDDERHEHRYPQTKHDGQLNQPHEQAAPDVPVEEPEAARDRLRDAPPAHDQLPQAELVDDGEGQEDDDEGHEDEEHAEHDREDSQPRRVREREGGQRAEHHGEEDHEYKTECYEEEQHLQPEHAPEVGGANPEG